MKFKVGDKVKYNINNTDVGIGIVRRLYKKDGCGYLIEVTKRNKITYMPRPREGNEEFYFYESELTLIDDFPELLKKAKEIRKLGNKLL